LIAKYLFTCKKKPPVKVDKSTTEEGVEDKNEAIYKGYMP